MNKPLAKSKTAKRSKKTMTKAEIRLKYALTPRQRELLAAPPSKDDKECPWIKYAGIFKDDPIFQEVVEDIAANRLKRRKLKHLP